MKYINDNNNTNNPPYYVTTGKSKIVLLIFIIVNILSIILGYVLLGLATSLTIFLIGLICLCIGMIAFLGVFICLFVAKTKRRNPFALILFLALFVTNIVLSVLYYNDVVTKLIQAINSNPTGTIIIAGNVDYIKYATLASTLMIFMLIFVFRLKSTEECSSIIILTTFFILLLVLNAILILAFNTDEILISSVALLLVHIITENQKFKVYYFTQTIESDTNNQSHKTRTILLREKIKDQSHKASIKLFFKNLIYNIKLKKHNKAQVNTTLKYLQEQNLVVPYAKPSRELYWKEKKESALIFLKWFTFNILLRTITFLILFIAFFSTAISFGLKAFAYEEYVIPLYCWAFVSFATIMLYKRPASHKVVNVLYYLLNIAIFVLFTIYSYKDINNQNSNTILVLIFSCLPILSTLFYIYCHKKQEKIGTLSWILKIISTIILLILIIILVIESQSNFSFRSISIIVFGICILLTFINSLTKTGTFKNAITKYKESL